MAVGEYFTLPCLRQHVFGSINGRALALTRSVIHQCDPVIISTSNYKMLRGDIKKGNGAKRSQLQ